MRAIKKGVVPFLAVLAIAMVLSQVGFATQDAALQGAWVRTSVTDTSGSVNSEPQPGLFVFSGTHYSMMYVNRAERLGNSSPPVPA